MKRFVIIFALALLITMSCLLLVSCDETTKDNGGAIIVEAPTQNNDGDIIEEAKRYILTVNNGKGVRQYTYDEGATVTVIADNIGKTFVCWEFEAVEVTKETNYSFKINNDVTLTAVYADSYLVYLDAKDGSGNSTMTLLYGYDYVLPVPTMENHYFEGWYYAGKAYTDKNGNSKQPFTEESYIMLEAKYKEKPIFEISITNGDAEELVTENKSYHLDTEVPVTAKAVPNRRFVAWVDEDGEIITTSNAFTFVVTEQRTFIAQYVEAYKVEVRGGSGSGYYDKGTIITIKLASLASGQRFVNWKINGVSEIDKTDTIFEHEVLDNISFEVLTEKISYILTYYLDDEIYGEPKSYYYNDTIIVPLSPQRTHYVFSGWLGLPENNRMPAKNLDIRGNFTLEKVRLYVTDGTGSGYYDWGTSVTAAATPPTGKQFYRWVTETGVFVSGANPYNFILETETRLFAEFGDTEYSLIFSINVVGEDLHNLPSFYTGEPKSVAGEYARFSLIYGQNTSESKNQVPTMPSCAHYKTFSGWSDIPTLMPARDLVITGTFVIQTHSITVNNGTINGEVTQGIFDYNQEITFIADIPIGWEFVHWKSGEYVESTQNPYIFNVERDGAYSAVIKQTEYYLRYYTKASYEEEFVEYHTENYKYGDNISSIASPSRANHYFGNWSAIPQTMPANDVRVEGIFYLDKHTVTVKAEKDREAVIGGAIITKRNGQLLEPAVTSATFEYGDIITILATPPIGLKFDDWTIAGAVVSTAQEYEFMLSGGVVITTRLSDKLYTLTYILDGNEEEPYAAQIYIFNQVIEPLPYPERANYHFSGWELADGALPSRMPDIESGELVCYGELIINKHTIVVQYGTITQINGVNVVETLQEGTFDYGTELTIAATLPVGKWYKKWITNFGEEYNIIGTPYAIYNGEYVYTLSKNIFISAIFEASKHTVTINSEYGKINGVTTSASTLDYNAEVIITTQGNKTGQRFVEIKKDNVKVSSEPTFVFNIVADTAIEVVYEYIPYEVRYVINGGGYTNYEYSKEYYIYTDIINTLGSPPPVPHYHFSGWSIIGYETFPQVITKLDKNILVNGEFLIDIHTISIANGTITKVNGTNLPSPVTSGSYAYGTNLSIVADNIIGEYFVKWVDENENTISTDSVYNFDLQENVSYVAVNEYYDYEVQYFISGATYEDNTPYIVGEHIYHYNDTINYLEHPSEIDNYVFIGWYLSDYTALPVTMPNISGKLLKVYGRYEHIYSYALTIDQLSYAIAKNTNIDASIYPTSIIIPNTYNEKIITEISANGFENLHISNVKVNNNIIKIGASAFKGTSITTIIVPFIGKELGATGENGKFKFIFDTVPATLRNITITDQLTVPDYAFENISMATSISLPQNITSIGTYAFSNCLSLTSITIPSTVITIGDYAFSGCSGVQTINYDAVNLNNLSINNNVFNLLATNVDIKIGGRVANIPNYLLSPTPYNSVDFVAETVTVEFLTHEGSYAIESIGMYAFSGLNLSGISLPNSINTIASYAFYYSALSSIIINSHITDIGNYAFANISNINLLYATNLSSEVNTNTCIFAGTTGIVTIQNNVTAIDDYLFLGANFGVAVFAPNSICTVIGEFAFAENEELTYVEIPLSVTQIGSKAFANAINLTIIDFNAANLNNFGQATDAFSSCGTESGLVVNIGNKVAHIPEYLFYSDTGCFANITAITVAEEGVCSSIGQFAFSNLDNLTTVAFFEFVKSIGNNAFENCVSLTSFTISAVTVKIAEEAFKNCTAITFNCEVYMALKSWSADWNYGNYPVTYGVNNISNADYSYVVHKSLVYITRYIGASVVVAVPQTIDTFTVNCIGNAFENNALVETVALPQAIESITDYAFSNCTNLQTVTYSGNITYLGKYAFNNCLVLTAFDIPSGITVISEGLFNSCAMLISTVLAPLDLSGITEIASGAFYGCEAISYIDLPPAITAINEYTFAYCINLESIYIPETVTYIAESAFVGCTGMQSFAVSANNLHYFTDGGVLFNKEQTILYHYPAASVQTGYVIPSSVEEISAYAFYSAAYLQSITIPSSVVYMGTAAFDLCVNLITINYSAIAAITEQEACVFAKAGQSGLGITVIIGENVRSIPKNLFNEEDINITVLTLGGSVEVIGENAFIGANIITLTIPSSVTSIGNNAFSNNTQLIEINYNAISANNLLLDNGVFAFGDTGTGVTVNIGSGVTHIPNYLFGNGTEYQLNITVLNFISTDLLTIGSYAFYGARVAVITIPNSVTGIGAKAFADNTLVENLYFNATNIADNLASDGVFANLGNLLTEGDFVNVFIGATVLNIPDYFNNGLSKVGTVTIDSTVLERVGMSAFLGTAITAISLPSTVKYIESRAFEYLAFSSLALPSDLLRIGASAFMGMNTISVLTLPITLQTIGADAFAYWQTLSVVTIPASVTEIGTNAFGGITNLATINYNATNVADEKAGKAFILSGKEDTPITVNIGSTVERIPNYLFTECEYIYTVIFSGNTVCHSIGTKAFYNLVNLATVVDLPDTVIFIGESAFEGCVLLEEISLLATVGSLTISESAFRECSNLTAVYFADSSALSQIGAYAFYNCVSLLTVSFGTESSLKSIGDFAFAKCAVLDLSIPSSLVNVIVEGQPTQGIGYNAFEDCTNLTSVTIPVGVLYILDECFKNCTSLTTVTMHQGIIYIGDSAFENCTALTAIEIPQSLAYLGSGAYKNCTSVTTLNYNATSAEYATVNDSTNDTFSDLGINTLGVALTFSADVKFIPDYLFYGTSESFLNIVSITFATNVSDMSSVFSIGERAFYYAANLTSLVLPEGLQVIGESAFAYCSSLETLTIPSSVALIKSKAFAYATKLTEIAYNAVDCEGFVYDFINVDKTDVFGLVGTYEDEFYTNEGINLVIGNSVLVLPERMFFSELDCSRVYTIVFELNSVLQEICDDAFRGHTSLTTITEIPDSIRTIGERAFYSCENLVSDMIMYDATSLGNEAFFNCRSLTKLHLTENLHTLGMSGTYMNCEAVTEVNINTYNLPRDAFSSFNTVFKGVGRPLIGETYGDSDGFVLNIGEFVNYLPNQFMHNFESFGIDKVIAEWTLNICEINIANPNLIIGDYAFSGVGKLTTLVLGSLDSENTLQVGNYAFYRCPDLTSVTLQNVLLAKTNGEQMEESTHVFAFTPITYLECVNDTYVPIIGSYAFYYCENLITINPNHGANWVWQGDIRTWRYEDATIGVIGDYAFANSGLIDVYLSSNLSTIGAHAFENCTGLITFRWPENVETIGEYAFYNCTSFSQTTFLHLGTLGSVHYNGVTISYAELYENGLGTLIGPTQTTLIIGDGDFFETRGTLITYIGAYAFYNTWVNIHISQKNGLFIVDENAFTDMNGTLSGEENFPPEEE